jgi:Tfp pilus assembly protein PilZ
VNARFVPRTEPRYSVPRDKELQATLEWVVDDQTVSKAGYVKDLSEHGLRLVLPEKPPVTEDISLQMEIAEFEMKVTLAGDICWIEPAVGGGWTLGCRLEGKLPEYFIQRLALAGVLERREDTRHASSQKAMARWELDSDGDFPVWIQNFSKCGLRLYANQPGKPGARLLIRLTDKNGNDREFAATSVWQLKADEGANFIGCTYSDVAAYGMLEHRLPLEALPDVNSLAPSLRLSTWCWVGLIAVFAWAGWQIWLN